MKKISVDSKEYCIREKTKDNVIAYEYLNEDNEWVGLSAEFVPTSNTDFNEMVSEELQYVLKEQLCLEISRNNNDEMWNEYLSQS